MKVPRLPWSRLKEKKILLPLAGIVSLLILYGLFAPSRTRALSADVRTGEFAVTITLSGEIKAAKSVTLSSPGVYYGGDLQIIWLIPEGTTVKSGETLARLDTANVAKFLTDQQSQLNIYLSDMAKMEADHRATMERLEAELKNAEFQFELSKLSLERVRFEAEVQRRERELQLKRDSIALEQSKVHLETQKVINTSEIDKVNVQILKARSDVDKAKRDLRVFTIKAPMPGLVVYEMNWRTGRKVAVSDQIWPGMSILSLPDLSKMQATGSVNEVDVSKVKKGQKVTIKLDAFPERTFAGTVISVGTIGQQTDRSSNIKTFDIEVDIDGTDPVLKPGMTASLDIMVETVPSAVYVPLESVFSKEGKTVVFRQNGFSSDQVEVETGVRNSNYITILKGLSGGEKVLLRDPSTKAEGEEEETPPSETKL